MKIGASTLASLEDGLENTLENIESLGIKYAELIHQYPNEYFDLDLLNSYDLKYTIHAPFLDTNIASLNTFIRKSSILSIEDSIDFANKIDAEMVVVHPGTIPFLFRNKPDEIYSVANKSIKAIGDYAKDREINVSIENMPEIDVFIYKNIDELAELLDEYEMNMTLDIGHANTLCYGADEMYFDCIKHIHMSDNFGNDDEHLALGEGSIDFKTCINEFKRKNYDGIYMIEVNNIDSIKTSYDFIKNNFKL